MAEPEIEVEHHPDPEDYNLPSDPSPARPLSPVTFFTPNVAPLDENMDLRPSGYTFSEEELDQPLEDGHGNFRRDGLKTKPIHPTERRKPQPYEGQGVATESVHTPQGTEQAPGIAGTKQGQPSDE